MHSDSFSHSFSSLNRRQVLRLLSGSALTLLAGRLAAGQTVAKLAGVSAPFDAGSCSYSVLTPELTEGPYYIDLEKIRRDITEGQPGVPLRLRIKVAHLSTGAPLSGAAVDVWHCNAQGVYSGFNSHLGPRGMGHHPPFPPPGSSPLVGQNGSGPQPPPGGFPPGGGPSGGFPPGGFQPGKFPPGGPGGPGGPGHLHKPDNQLTFLRGVQFTDATGVAIIDTIFPGWYMGRTTHIHVRVHNGGVAADGRYRKGHISHTGQIFFPEETTNHIYEQTAYVKKADGRVVQKQDGIFREGGSQVVRLIPLNAQQPMLGYYSDSVLVIDPAATPARA